MFSSHRVLWLGVWVLLLGGLPAARARAAADAEAVSSAVYLLQASVRPQSRGQHNALLRALRHLRDPELKPLFERLLASGERSLAVHGLLGLAECDARAGLDLTRLASIKDQRTQADAVSAALDGDLLTAETCKQILGWPDLDLGLKVIACLPRVQAGDFRDTELLNKALASSNPAQMGMAALVLTQLGDAAGPPGLDKVEVIAGAARDAIRDLLLRTALRFELDRTGNWAMKVAREPKLDPRVQVLALRAALRFKAAGAADLWRERFAAETDEAQRIRLALLALRCCQQVEAGFFRTLAEQSDPLLKQVGLTGAAVTSGQEPTAAVEALVALHHPLATDWALEYARTQAKPEAVRAIVTAVILAAEGGDRGRAQRLEDAINAVQMYVEKDAKAAAEAIKPILQKPKLDPLLAQGILLGVLKSKGGKTDALFEGLGSLGNRTADAMALLLAARQGRDLTDDQWRELALVVRGGLEVADTLRLQAAWLYLQHFKQSESALKEVLK